MKRLAIAAALLLLAACDTPTTGVITGKQHLPAHDETTAQPRYRTVCTGTGAATVCRMEPDGVDPVVIHHPECWQLTLDTGDGPAEICVDRAVYDRLAVGDRYEGR